ncbi:cyclic nucleotide-gated cation channel beta-1 [Neocloeon triangulifer]|uniref:cyclic nucleotide-gated cation channel beta-1 n=1 Tax=Neocloeon triangulifer TaxID=2078957 RepID=UPI00286F4031|nr:cyclic nucleotide-gated cation channel beta-1 [Neocloeon triangulifer]XP_059469357.1 cyclic nucleotide-gated cation channel beta-1 [Neocloeon triangulifer]
MASPDVYEMSHRSRGYRQRPHTAPTASYSFDSEYSTASNTPRPSIYTISRSVVFDDSIWQGGCSETINPVSRRRYAIPRGVARLVRNLSGRRRREAVPLRPRSAPFSIAPQNEDNTVRLAKLSVQKLQPKKAAPNLSTKVAPSQSTDLINSIAKSTISLDDPTMMSNTGYCWKRNIDPQSHSYIGWLSLVAMACLYNCWVIPLRCVFPYQTPENTPIWLTVDFCADIIYVIDMAFVQPRVMFISQGLWVNDRSQMRRNYLTKIEFKLDVLSLIPLDLLYFWLGTDTPWLRLPRFFKVHAFWEFFSRLESVLASPHLVRVARTVLNMLYMVHLNACAYYAFSDWEGLGSNRWTISGIGNVYVRAFYFATKTATSIGKNPKPENEKEYVFMTVSWLMGVFVFALLIGQVRDIIATATRGETEYRRLLDQMLQYMSRLNLPHELQCKVKLWLTYTWQEQKTLDESAILESLPPKMKTDIALNVHISTLDKVQLFSDCDAALIRDLVLKLRPVIYLPGDYVCRKGEVGKEMYIVKTGVIQVVADNGEMLATLREGSVFGEISLLSLAGGNRRTADVRSQGYSNLFVLSKADLNEAIQHYPEAQEILRKKAEGLVAQNAERERQRELQGSSTSGLGGNSSPNLSRIGESKFSILSTPSHKTVVTLHAEK